MQILARLRWSSMVGRAKANFNRLNRSIPIIAKVRAAYIGFIITHSLRVLGGIIDMKQPPLLLKHPDQ